MEVSVFAWGATLALIAVLLCADVWIHRTPKETSIREAGWATVVWTLIGLAFGGIVWAISGSHYAAQYFAGYLLERTLSIDNVFVFVLILSYFAVPPVLQHRALFWGVLGALVLRGIFILVGAALLHAFEWTIYIFGAFLLYTAFKLLTGGDHEVDPDKNGALRLMRRAVPVSNEYSGNKLFVRDAISNKRIATPLFAVFLVLGTTDVVFAVDSIPAVFAVTRQPFLVMTSNAFAVLGLRPMAALLESVMHRFAYLKHSLALVLALVGLKMMVSGFIVVNVWLSLVVIALILCGGIGLSVFKTRA